MANKVLSFTAAGDMLVQRRLPADYEGLKDLISFIAKGDLRYFNLETTLNRGEGWANQYCGGSWLRMDPEVLDDVKRFGFNMTSLANNHMMDFDHWGLLKTLEAMEAAGFAHAGAGRNLAEAAAPAYYDTPNGRYAIISACSTFEPPAMAGEQSRRLIGRPGLNGIRHDEKFEITKEQMAVVKQIAEQTNINARADIARKDGYWPAVPEGTFKLGTISYVQGDTPHRISSINKNDMKRVKNAIFEAEFQADFVAVAIHSHEIQGDSKDTPSDFLIDFAHACIDAGAHAVIGTGPHVLRPIEIYKGRPIFYSLGDFMLENENIPYGPTDFYENYGLTPNDTMRELFTNRSKNFTRGLQTDRRAFESVIPYCEYVDGTLARITLLPIELGFGKSRAMGGLPAPMPNAAFLRRLADMSQPFGTKIEVTADGLAQVIL